MNKITRTDAQRRKARAQIGLVHLELSSWERAIFITNGLDPDSDDPYGDDEQDDELYGGGW